MDIEKGLQDIVEMIYESVDDTLMPEGDSYKIRKFELIANHILVEYVSETRGYISGEVLILTPLMELIGGGKLNLNVSIKFPCRDNPQGCDGILADLPPSLLKAIDYASRKYVEDDGI